MTHPTSAKLISKIRIEQSSNEISLEKLGSGHELPKPKQKYSEIYKRIENLVQEYPRMRRLEFLRGISYNLSSGIFIIFHYSLLNNLILFNSDYIYYTSLLNIIS